MKIFLAGFSGRYFLLDKFANGGQYLRYADIPCGGNNKNKIISRKLEDENIHGGGVSGNLKPMWLQVAKEIGCLPDNKYENVIETAKAEFKDEDISSRKRSLAMGGKIHNEGGEPP